MAPFRTTLFDIENSAHNLQRRQDGEHNFIIAYRPACWCANFRLPHARTPSQPQTNSSGSHANANDPPLSSGVHISTAQSVSAASGRALTQFAPVPSFPYCRCDDYAAASSPYKLTMTNTTGLDDGLSYGEYCFTIEFVGGEGSVCRGALTDSIHKFLVSIQGACVPAFDVTNNYITVGGKKKTSSWRAKDFATASVLELFSLGLNSAHSGTKICMRASAPCDQPENFFDTMPPTVGLSESAHHKCCPVMKADI
eukprot:gene9740-7615_t